MTEKETIADARSKQNLCLHCETAGTDEAPLRRGICSNHYAQFRNELHKQSPENREQFEQKAISLGMVLPSRQGKRTDATNPFKELAERLLPETDKQFLREVAKTKEQFNKPIPRKGKK
jgi:sulfite reductase alpha subunit-like flavoprotein